MQGDLKSTMLDWVSHYLNIIAMFATQLRTSLGVLAEDKLNLAWSYCWFRVEAVQPERMYAPRSGRCQPHQSHSCFVVLLGLL